MVAPRQVAVHGVRTSFITAHPETVLCRTLVTNKYDDDDDVTLLGIIIIGT